jgi:hypothetical protein
MQYTERQTGRAYRLFRIDRPTGRFMDRATLVRYEVLKRYV